MRNLFIDEPRRRNTRGTGVNVQDLAEATTLSAPAATSRRRTKLSATARPGPNDHGTRAPAPVDRPA